MRIEIKHHEIVDNNHVIDIRVEQELEPNNSISQYVKFNAEDIIGLSNSEIYTKAYYKVKLLALDVFKKVQYQDEDDNPIDFSLVQPKAKVIKIVGSELISKEVGKDHEAHYEAKIFDQYGDYMKNTTVKLDGEYEGVDIVDGKLSVTSYSGQIKLVASYYSNLTELLVNIEEYEPVMSDQEIIMSAIAELYEMIGVVNSW